MDGIWRYPFIFQRKLYWYMSVNGNLLEVNIELCGCFLVTDMIFQILPYETKTVEAAHVNLVFSPARKDPTNKSNIRPSLLGLWGYH